VEAAAPLFLAAGYRSVTMDTVARAAGITKATIYYHFPDKPAVFVAAAQSLCDRVRGSLEQIMARPDALPDRLQAVARSLLGVSPSVGRLDTLIAEALPDLSDEQAATVRQCQRAVLAVLEDACIDAANRSDIRRVDPLFVAHAFLALVRMVQAVPDDTAPLLGDPDTASRLLVDMLWHGVGLRREREASRTAPG
jgi:AcrR family transcriptional regulator